MIQTSIVVAWRFKMHNSEGKYYTLLIWIIFVGCPGVLVFGDTVAFTARAFDPITNVEKGSTVVYLSAEPNIGGGYNDNTGIFTSPVTGTYVFSLKCLVKPKDLLWLDVIRNNAQIGRCWADARGTKGFQSDGATVVVNLTIGDKVFVKIKNIKGTKEIHENGFNTFTGFLLDSE